MPKSNCTFRKRDVTAAVRAVIKAGVEVARVDVAKDGKIIVVTGKPSEPVPADGAKSTRNGRWGTSLKCGGRYVAR